MVSLRSDFPNTCLIGIQNSQYVIDDTDGEPSIHASLFYFDQATPNEDGWHEISINWRDDDGALTQLLELKGKKGEILYQEGAAEMEKDKLELALQVAASTATLSYERKPVKDNHYHGNILLKEGISKPKIRLIAATLALICSFIRRD